MCPDLVLDEEESYNGPGYTVDGNVLAIAHSTSPKNIRMILETGHIMTRRPEGAKAVHGADHPDGVYTSLMLKEATVLRRGFELGLHTNYSFRTSHSGDWIGCSKRMLKDMTCETKEEPASDWQKLNTQIRNIYNGVSTFIVINKNYLETSRWRCDDDWPRMTVEHCGAMTIENLDHKLSPDSHPDIRIDLMGRHESIFADNINLREVPFEIWATAYGSQETKASLEGSRFILKETRRRTYNGLFKQYKVFVKAD